MSDLLEAPRSISVAGAGGAVRAKGQVNASAARLLRAAEVQLRLARRPDDLLEQFSHIHFAALRLAGAVLAVTEVGKRVPRNHSIWDRLENRAPELAGWGPTFARSAQIRAALELGRFDVINRAEALRWYATVEEFRDRVFDWFGLDPLLDFDTQYTLGP